MSGSQNGTRMSSKDVNLILAALRRHEARMDAMVERAENSSRMDAREALMDSSFWSSSSSAHLGMASTAFNTTPPLISIATNHVGVRDDFIVKGEGSSDHEAVVREPEPSMDEEESSMEELKNEPCGIHVVVEPRFKSLPSIKPSSLTSLETPWPDATRMVVSFFPFQLLEHMDINREEKEASLSKSSKGVLLEPNLPFFLHRCLCTQPCLIVPLKSCCLHLVCHYHVGRKLKFLHDASLYKTRYSCIHQSFHSQFLSQDKGNIICMKFVVKNMMCISCSILKHIFKLRLGNTCSWRFICSCLITLILLSLNISWSLTSFCFFVKFCALLNPQDQGPRAKAKTKPKTRTAP